MSKYKDLFEKVTIKCIKKKLAQSKDYASFT